MQNKITDRDVLDAFECFLRLDFKDNDCNGLANLVFKNTINLIEQKNNTIIELERNIANTTREYEKQLDEQYRFVEEATRKDAWRELAERLKNYIKQRKIKYIGVGTIDKIKEEMLNCEGWE